MKKYMIAGALCLCFQGFLKAQTQDDIRFGLHAGPNISNFAEKISYQDGSSLSGHEKAKVGFTGGVDASISLGHNWYLQPELNFSQMGIKSSGNSGDNNNYNTKMGLNYLNLPILAKYVIEGTGLGIYAGPQYGYLLSAKASLMNGNNTASASATNYFYRSDFSLLSGLEYYLPNGLGLSVRSYLGLSNTLKDPSIMGADLSQAKSVSIKNRSVAITIGYRF